MSVQLHPDIEQLDRSSLCYSIYSQLYHNFFNAQQKKDAEHPYGVEEGDETSVRLKNTAYGFASAIAGAVTGEGGESGGGLLIDYLKKTGGDMTGIFRANYGFEAGVANTRILETYSEDITDADGVVSAIEYGVKITGNLKLGGDALYLGGRNILRYDPYKATATIDASNIDLLSGSVHSSGEWTIGDKDSGIFISPTSLQVGGKDVYHKGNANLSSVDWAMQNGTVYKDLTVHGTTTLGGALSAKYGVQLGDKGNTLLSFSGEDVALSGYLSFLDGFGIRIAGKSILTREGESIRVGSIGGDLLLGSDDTPKIRLFSGISDIDGECLMLSPYGKACFPGSLSVRHNYGADLLSSYRVDSNDEGIIIHKKLRFGSADGILIKGDKEHISLSSDVVYEKDGVQTFVPHKTSFRHLISTSKYAPQNRYSETFFVSTDADFVVANVPVEAVGHIGIDNSFTQLPEGVVQNMFGITGVRTWKELQGIPCIEFEDGFEAKQSICVSRSFSSEIYEIKELQEQIANFASTMAKKLRKQHSVTSEIVVFAYTNRFKEDAPQTYSNALVSFVTPTADQRTIITEAVHAMQKSFKSGYGYKKAGVIATKIIDERNVMHSLFEDTEAIEREHKITSALDAINSTFGKGTIKLAVQGSGKIKTSSESQSPHYTTLWSDIPNVTVK